MRILQISNYLYPVISGIGRVTEDAAHFFARDGIEQKILCFNEDASADRRGKPCRKTVRDDFEGAELIRCGCVAKLFSQSLSPAFPGILHRTLREFRPDVVIFHYPNPFAAHFLLRERLPFRLILWWHSDIVKSPLLCRLFHRQNLRLIRRADLIVGATPRHLSGSGYAPYFPAEKRRIVPYTVGEYRLPDPSAYEAQAEAVRSAYAGKTLCLFVGRHVAYKGLTHLIAASRLLDDRFVFLIAGSGVLTEPLREQAGGDGKVRFLGVLSETEKLAYLRACDIFCFPSVTKNESFGLALAEALYFGKPAVTFTIPDSGVNLVSVDGKTGLECPNGDSAALADAIRRLADDPALRSRCGAAARAHILENYSDETFRRSLNALLDGASAPEESESI